MIIANAYRFYGHGRKDPSPYRSTEEEAEWKGRDPIASYKQRLIDERTSDVGQFQTLEAEVKSEIDRAVEWAAASPPPSDEELYTDVFAGEV